MELDKLEPKWPEGEWYVDGDDRPGMEWNNHIMSAPNQTICFMAHNPEDNTELEAAAVGIASMPRLWHALKDLLDDYYQRPDGSWDIKPSVLREDFARKATEARSALFAAAGQREG